MGGISARTKALIDHKGKFILLRQIIAKKVRMVGTNNGVEAHAAMAVVTPADNEETKDGFDPVILLSC